MILGDIGIIICGNIASIAEIIIVVRFLIKSFGWSPKVKSYIFSSGALCVLLFLISQMNGEFKHSHLLVVLIDICVLFIFCRIFLNGNQRIQLLGCLLVFLVIAVSNVLIMQVLAFLESVPVYRFLVRQGHGFLVGVVLSKLMLWFILNAIQGIMKKRGLNLSKQYYFIVNGLIVFTIVIQLMLFYVMQLKVYSPVANKILIAVSVCFAMLSCYMGYSVFRIGEQNTKLMNYELLQLEHQQKEQQILEIERADSRVKQLVHDYKNHCISMQELLIKGKYMELEEYLQNLTGRYLGQGQDFVHTNNDIIDAVLNTKIWYCKDKHIDIYSFITGDLSSLKGLEVSVILFNLLDNAIEACLKNINERKIEVLLAKGEHYFELFVKNTITNSVLDKNKDLISDKKEKNMHGIGHISVETIVEEEDGIIEYYEENKLFCVHIFMPLI